jgi:hypothetical protein
VSDDNPAPGGDYNFLTQASCKQYSDGTSTFDVPESGHSQLNVGNFVCIMKVNTLDRVSAEIDIMLSAEFEDVPANIGVVYHAHEYDARRLRNSDVDRDGSDCSPDEYANDLDYIEALFELFTHRGVDVVTGRDLLMGEQLGCGE